MNNNYLLIVSIVLLLAIYFNNTTRISENFGSKTAALIQLTSKGNMDLLLTPDVMKHVQNLNLMNKVKKTPWTEFPFYQVVQTNVDE
jgi:hypothetical protein